MPHKPEKNAAPTLAVSAHFKSRPQHPMTPGKIERFWASVWQEFLTRAQFESFDAARERIRAWSRYYNQKRPHQGIGGLCPADLEDP